MMLGPTNATYRASAGGVEIRLRLNPDVSWIVIRQAGAERYFDIHNDQVATLIAEFQAIGDSVERFRAFVRTIEASSGLSWV